MPDYTAPAIRRRIVAVIFIVSSLVSAAQVASFTLMSILAADLSGSASAAGLPSTAALLFRAVAAYPLGWVMGRFGRRPGLVAGLLFGLAGTALAAWAIASGSFALFTLGSGAAGVAAGAALLSRFAAAEVTPPEGRAQVIGWIVFAGTVGALIGPLLVSPAVSLADRLGLAPQTGPFWASALVLVVSVALTFALLRPDPLAISRRLETEGPSVEAADRPRQPMSRYLREPHVRLGVAAMGMSQLVMVLIMVITPLHMNHTGHGTGAISVVILAHQLGMFGLSFAAGWLIDRLGAAAVIIGGAALLVVASLLSPAFQSVTGLSVVLFLLGLGWNFCFVAGSSLLAVGLPPAERTRVQGMSDGWVAAASALGSLITGPLFAAGAMLLVGAVGLAMSLALITGWFLLRGRRLAAPA